MVDITRLNSLFCMYCGHAERVALNYLRGDRHVVPDLGQCHQGGQRRHVHRVWGDRRPGIGCRDRRVDRHGRLDEHDGLGGVASGDDGGRWLNGINGVYPRVPLVDVMLGLRAGFPGGG